MILDTVQSMLFERSLHPVQNIKYVVLFWSIVKHYSKYDYTKGKLKVLTAMAEIAEQD